MPAKKKATKKQPTETTMDMAPEESTCSCETPCSCNQNKSKMPLIIICLALLLIGIFAVSKGYVVSAVINGRPVFRWNVDSTLMSRYGKQTMESIISEQLILDEAKKTNVQVTQKEIDEKEAEILKSFGGNISLEEVLQYQGITKKDFDSQVRLQLFVFKLLGKDETVNNEEVKAFIEKNKTMMTATDEAGMNEEAKGLLLEQKINDKIQPWFSELKAKAKILRFF